MKLISNRTTAISYGLICLICVIAAILRFRHLGETGIWFDESSSCRWIDFPVSELIQRTSQDCHPPFYWLLLKGWRQLIGGSVPALRSMSVVFGVATVWAAFQLGQQINAIQNKITCEAAGNLRSGGMAAFLVALSPFHVEWSQEMRMYSLGTFLVVTSTWLLLKGLQDHKGGRGVWVAYSALGIISFYTLYFSVFIFLTHGLFVTGWSLNRGIWPRKFVIAIVGMVVGCVGWLPVVWGMYSTAQRSFPQGPLTWLDFSSMYWQMFVPAGSFEASDTMRLILIEVSGVIILCLLASRSAGKVLIGLCAFLPIYAIVNVSLVSQNLAARHRLILGQVFLLIGFAVLIQSIRPSWLRWGSTFVAVFLSVFTLNEHLAARSARADMPGMKAAMEFVTESRGEQDAVFFVNPMLYLNGIVYAREQRNIFSVGKRFDYSYYEGSSLTRDSDHLELKAIPATCNSVWIVDADQWMGGSWHLRMPESWEFVAERQFQEYYALINVKLYRRKTL